MLGLLADSGRELSTAAILFHETLSRRVGLGITEEKVLELVLRHEHESVTELARHAGIAKNSFSDILDRLERKAFIERQPDPSDGRKVSVRATASGVSRISALFDGFMARLSELNAEYSTEDLALVAEYQRRAAAVQAAAARVLAADSPETN
ncbi:MAG: MarR family transcriptional regulator [Cryobacterium sp.]|nr:MarR family transcriptional regulator [Cryobacterium sp.]